MALLDRRNQGGTLQRLIRFVRSSPRAKWWSICSNLGEFDAYWNARNLISGDRTAYVVGLFGSGRDYMTQLMYQHFRKRAKYIRVAFRYRSCRSSMIYSGHATIKYASRFQARPEVTRRVLEAVSSGLADLIFIYRHPLDSVLTNWVWWRIYLRHKVMVPGISAVYKSIGEFSVDLKRHFDEFKAFASGDPKFFEAAPGMPFLSVAEFVEETELYLQCATLSLRLEDFSADARREFSKVVQAMSVDVDLSRSQVDPPKTKPYGYLAVKENVPRFRAFIEGLDAETKRRIEEIGYQL